MTKDDALREVLRIMNQGPDASQPPRVTLRDGSSFEGVPFSIQSASPRALLVQFIVNAEPAPRTVNADEIASVSG